MALHGKHIPIIRYLEAMEFLSVNDDTILG